MNPYKAVAHVHVAGVRTALLLTVGLLLSTGAELASASDSAGRAWTSQDSVAVRYFGPDLGLWADNAKKPAAQFSHDGKYFYIMSGRGELADDSAVQTLEVYETAQLAQWLKDDDEAPLPTRTVLERPLFSRVSRFAIAWVRWTSDSRALTFVGRNVQDQEQIYRLHVPSGRLEQLTDDPYPTKLEYQMEGDALLYSRQQLNDDISVAPYPIFAIPRDEKGEVMLARLDVSLGTGAVRAGDVPWILPQEIDFGFKIAFNRDAQRAVVLTLSRNWVNGAPPVPKFMLVDFVQRQARELSEARSAPDSKVTPQAFWSPDDTSIVLVGTTIPDGVKVDGRNSCPCIASYTPTGNRWQVLEPMGGQDDGRTTKAPAKETNATTRQRRHVGSVQAVRQTGALLVSHLPESRGVTQYEWKNDRWTASRAVPGPGSMLSGASAAAAGTAPEGLKIEVRQSQNDPPQLLVSDGKREKALSRPDPALEGVWRARVEPFTTRTPDGTEVKGALSLPREGKKALPLVIQIGYDYGMPDLFLPDGPTPVAFARQVLNARGIAVLSIDATGIQTSAKRNTPQEGPAMVDQIDAAVEVLIGQGTIDPKRVGVLGFSRTGYQTFYAITHPKKTAVAAAEVFDATTFNYVQYLQMTVLGVAASNERLHDGSFWQNKGSWLEHDVLFNADRIEAPTLFVEVGETRDSGRLWKDYSMLNLGKLGALIATHRPFETLIMPQGQHAMLLPRQRKATIDATVDWMAFWLTSYEDPAPEKAQQYVRWHQIRERNEQRKAATTTPPAGG